MDRGAVVDGEFGLTGSHGVLDRGKTIKCPLDKYEVCIRVTSDNRFVRVESIRIRREFVSAFLKANPKGHIDVDDLYLADENPKE